MMPSLAIADIDAMSLSTLRSMWHGMAQPTNDEERDVSERLAIRAEGCGLVDANGMLVK